MAKQVVIASSVTPKDVNDALLSQETTYDIPDVVQPPATDRKGGLVFFFLEEMTDFPANFAGIFANSIFGRTFSLNNRYRSLFFASVSEFPLKMQ